MKSFSNLLEKSKSIYKSIVASMFDSNNPETAVEQLLKSTEIDSDKTIEKQDDHSVVYSSLYNEPSKDFYMESKEEKDKRCEEEVKNQHINGDIKLPPEESEININSGNQLIYELTNLLEDLNLLNIQTDDENVKSTIMYCENRIVEIMLSNGCESIDNDLSFDNSRHVPSPFSFLPNGCTINKTVKPGISYKSKVLIKAIVECKL